ncbi:DUF3467 domain-containing protein [Methanococcus sp. CF]
MDKDTSELKKTDLIYVNNLGASLGPFEVILNLGTQVENNIINSANVVMSPQHLKVFAKTLNKMVSDYEDIFGPIPEVKVNSESKIVKGK